ncbi:MAG: GTP 3',8-cyclase MoaA [Cytophagales bacterium]|nr:MAG: GTP 3',8-cyclase MoaA [Cytophagales bacterium]
MTLYDNHQRPIHYLRLAVTDRCNLRCFYCMPAEGIPYLPKKELLSDEEMLWIVRLLAKMGISKVRITGGEPFLRRDLMAFLEKLVQIEGIAEWHITTNGVLTAPHLATLKSWGIGSINLSLDSLDAQRFYNITRRNDFQKVMQTLEQILHYDIPLKINAVVMSAHNIDDLIPLADLTRDLPIEVRFIEEMPFNGEGIRTDTPFWTHKHILAHLQQHFPNLQPIDKTPFGTAEKYQIVGHKGTLGIIAAFSRTFCGTCNRIRITAQGVLKTCLYDNGVLQLRDIVRAGISEEDFTAKILSSLGNRPKDGFEAEASRQHQPISESMSIIGG